MAAFQPKHSKGGSDKKLPKKGVFRRKDGQMTKKCKKSYRATELPSYSVSLDESPEERWRHVFSRDDAGVLRRLISAMWASFEDTRGQSREEKLAFAERLLAAVAEDLEETGAGYIVGEMRGVAKLLGVETCELLLLHLSYESLMGCTSALLADSEGCVRLARTLDWDILPLKALSIHVDFYRGGRLAWQATSFKGYCGCLTGMRSFPEPYAAAVNWRGSADEETERGEKEENGDKGGKEGEENGEGNLSSQWPIGFFVRHALQERCDSYGAFVELLAATPLMAPCYVVVAGSRNGEGAVLTKDEGRAGLHAWRQQARVGAVVVQANVDSATVWEHYDITGSIERCRFVREHTNPLAPDKQVLEVLLRSPVCDDDTLSITIACPRMDRYRDYVPVRR